MIVLTYILYYILDIIIMVASTVIYSTMIVVLLVDTTADAFSYVVHFVLAVVYSRSVYST